MMRTRLQRVLHSMLSARILLHIREAMAPREATVEETMTFAAARGKPDPANVELGELQSDDSSRYIHSISSRGANIQVSDWVEYDLKVPLKLRPARLRKGAH